jgi:hypothetical protein
MDAVLKEREPSSHLRGLSAVGKPWRRIGNNTRVNVAGTVFPMKRRFAEIQGFPAEFGGSGEQTD